jgi:fused signal recognition particle receptor
VSGAVVLLISVGVTLVVLAGVLLFAKTMRSRALTTKARAGVEPAQRAKDRVVDATDAASSRGADVVELVITHDEAASDTIISLGDQLADDDAPVIVDRPRFRDRLGRARDLFGGFRGGLLKRGITDETWDDLEEALLSADVGVGVSTTLLDNVRAQVKDQNIKDPAQLVELLRSQMLDVLSKADRELAAPTGDAPNVWLFVGVNGVGKTTTIGKLAKVRVDAGDKVVLAAGDTFRAAAADQLSMWADRSGAAIIRGNEGGDPGAVVFDAVAHAKAKGAALVLADTAGRLQNKVNLMEELKKIRRIADKEPAVCTEVLLVLDATTGQNGLRQAEVFGEAVQLTGVVLTKLDGTAKGGVAFAIEQQLGIPIKLVGLGESVHDLVPFDPAEFVDALLAE